MEVATVREAARSWALMDPNPTTRRHVEDLLDAATSPGGGDPTAAAAAAATAAERKLGELFPTDGSRIAFGTAGLRAEMRPGPLGMNDLVVLQAAQGLARYCQERGVGTVVIGYDHRARAEFGLSSRGFALHSALAFREAGLRVVLLDGLVATPLVPFAAARGLPAGQRPALGVMVTASHNPKRDAGYKVYWTDGCQIRPPIDAGMATAIAENLVPWTDYRALLRAQEQAHQGQQPSTTEGSTTSDDSCLGLSDPATTRALVNAYYAAVASSGLITGPIAATDAQAMPSVRFCYTAMHGVGYPFARRMFEAFGLPPFDSVPEQQEPDPEFGTVPFPNPEEAGALARAQAYAEAQGCHVILANDPDADRLAVAERADTGAWTVFTGDQIGVLLGHWLWERFRDRPAAPPLAMCASSVSSGMLREIARIEDFHFEDTLTGFKWIGTRAAELRAVFCYEEAIGFCCGDVVYDKDGLTAAAVLAELTLAVYDRGRTLAQHMQSLYDKYGEFVSKNGYFVIQDPSLVSRIMDDLTNHGAFDKLDSVGRYKVEAVRYLGLPGYDSRTSDRQPTLPVSSSSPMLSLYLANGLVAHFRGSGTEPKFKYYLELKGRPGVPRSRVASDLEEIAGAVLTELFAPYGLMG